MSDNCQTELIGLSDSISFTVGKFYDTRYWYFTCVESEYWVNDLFGIDAEKPFATVESARKYAEKQVSIFLKKNMFLLNKGLNKKLLKVSNNYG